MSAYEKKIKFGTGGFRGIIGDGFNKENVRLIAQALANIALKNNVIRPVIIGYDNRFMSDHFAGYFAEVLAGNGISVYMYTQSVPSPVVMCATRDYGNDYGVMITASHNPYIYNGVKLFVKGGADADVDFTRRLEKEIELTKEVKDIPLASAKANWLVQDFTNIEVYLSHIKRFVSPKIKQNKAKILYDNMCGVGAVGLAPLSKEFNIAKFDMLNANHDAFFNFDLPNPTEQEMEQLKTQVLDGMYDYAMATDSDGDRLGIIDENGDYVNNNDILGALYYYLVKYRGFKGDIVKNCATSVLIDKLAAKFGYKCHEVDVGFKNISQKIQETDALIGGESSGGLTCRGYLFGKDSIFSASLFMEMQIIMNKPVSKIIKEVHDFASYGDVIVEDLLEISLDAAALDKLSENAPPFTREIINTDRYGNNVKYHFQNDCWVLLRMSGTEPVLRLFVEMPDKNQACEQLGILKEYLKGNVLM